MAARGLARDTEEFGTRGHVDMVATIPSPGRILLHAQTNAAHPDHAIMRQVRQVLRESRDAQGNPWRS